MQTYLANRDKSVHYNLIETDRNEVTRQVLDGEADLGLLVRSPTDAKAFLWYTEARRLDIYLLDQAGVYAMVGSRPAARSRCRTSCCGSSARASC